LGEEIYEAENQKMNPNNYLKEAIEIYKNYTFI